MPNPTTTRTAAELPFGSIVAMSGARVWVKEDHSEGCGKPWAASHYGGALSDGDVDAVLAQGGVVVRDHDGSGGA